MNQNICRTCGAVLTPDLPRGLCPKCLLAGGIPPLAPIEIDPSAQPVLQSIGHYDLIHELGQGGMGIVFKARHRTLNRVVALKMLLLGRWTNPRFVERFRAEARASAALRHPAIVAIHEIGEHDNQPWFTMDYIAGPSLGEVVREHPLPAREAARLVHVIAEAVHHAHAHGILHRDLKPSNILLDEQHRPHITDFGLSKEIRSDSDLTLSGQALGSPHYMPPEQVSGARQATPAADIYSLGAILYHLLTGRPPFQAETLEATLLQVLQNQPARPRLLNSQVPVDLETICLKCLEKNQTKRYVSAQNLADELQRYLDNEPIHARPISPAGKVWRWCQRKPALATAYGLLLLILILILIISPIAAYRINQARKSAATEALRARRSEYAADMSLAQSLVEKHNRGAAIRLLEKYERPEQDPEFIPPHAREGDLDTDLRHWEWHYLSTITRGQEIAALRGHETRLTDVAFSPDGRWLASSEINGVVNIWDPQARSRVARLTLPPPTDLKEIFALAFSADGTRLAATADVARQVYLWAVPSWQVTAVLTNNYRANALAFSPDGHFLAVAGTMTGQAAKEGNGVTLWNLRELQPVASWPFRLPPQSGPPFALTFSADSKWLLHDLTDGLLGRWSTETREQLPPLHTSGQSRSIQRALFTRNGKWAATCSTDGVLDVWSMPDWKRAYQLTNEWLLAISEKDDLVISASAQELHRHRLSTGERLDKSYGHLESLVAAAVSPTGDIIATASNDTTIRLWPIQPKPDRKSSVQLSTNSFPKIWHHRPQIGLDGKYAVTVESGDRTFSIWDLDRLEPLRAHPWPFDDLAVIELGPSGKIAALGASRGNLAVIDLVTDRVLAQTRRATNLIQFLRFSPDGSRLAVVQRDPHVTGDSNPFSLEVLKLTNSRLESFRTLNCTGGSVHSAAFTPDNRYFVYGFWSSLTELADLETGRVIASFRGQQGRIIGVAITPDARLVATISSQGDGTLRLWDGRTGQQLGPTLRGSWEHYDALALSVDGRRLAASAEGVDLWDLTTLRVVQTFPAPGDWIMSLAWTSDRHQLVAASQRSIRAWRANAR